MTTDAQKRASRKYDQENTKNKSIKLNLKNDADILERWENLSNAQGFIKAMFRNNIKMLGLNMEPSKLVRRVGIEGELINLKIVDQENAMEARYQAEMDTGVVDFSIVILPDGPVSKIDFRNPSVKINRNVNLPVMFDYS